MYKIYLLVFIFTLIVPTYILGSYSYKKNDIKYSFPKSVLVSKKSDTFFYNDLGFRLFQDNCLIGNIYTTFPSNKSIQLIKKLRINLSMLTLEEKLQPSKLGKDLVTQMVVLF